MATTIKDVAKRAGVGAGTVSRVLNGGGSVSEEKANRVKEAIEALHFVPNKNAAKLRRNASGVLALLVPLVSHPFFANLAYYVEDEADKHGYSILLISSQQRIFKEEEILRRIRRKEVDGAIFVTHFVHDKRSIGNCNIVSIDRPLGEDIPYVTTDNYEATKRAVEYLIEKGCTKIGYIGSKPLVESEVLKREEAYRDVMKAHNMTERVISDVILHGEEENVATRFLEEYGGVDGVFASGYTMAQVFYETATKRGIRIPQDMQEVSYDGSFLQWGCGRMLTCVEQPIEEMARTAVRLLIAKIKGKNVPCRTVLPTKFVVGDTTKM